MLDPSQTVAQIVLDHSETAAVFQRHRIDFCCRGDMSVAEACAGRGVQTDVVVHDLEEAIASREGADVDPRTTSTVRLIDHIVQKHHGYLRRALPFVQGLAIKVARVHGDHDPRLRELADVVAELAETLVPHLDDEERSLFPLLLDADGDRERIERELTAMQSEHLAVGALLEQMRTAAANFEIPDWACRSFRALFAELEELEGDVLRHVHLENHVLAPRFAA